MLALIWQLPLAVAILASALWGAGALWYRGQRWRGALVVGWSVLYLIGVIGLWLDSIGWLALPGLALLAVLGWWRTIRPAHHRNWAPDIARLLRVEQRGSQVRLHNVRNFDWRSETEFTPRWEVRDYDIDQIVSIDLVCSYWMGPVIAHTLVSFGFADGRQLVFSVEVRRLAGEQFSAIGGLFRQCELAVVAADERDIIRTRSNIRGEDVYAFRVALPRDETRALFNAYLHQAEALIDSPRFYNTLTSNCTTLIYDMVKRIEPRVPWNYRLLASGYLPDYLYDLDALPMQCSLAELRRHGHINARAIASDPAPSGEGPAGQQDQASPDFSRAIRRGLPRLSAHDTPAD